MLYPPLTPLNRRPNVPDLPDPQRARPPAQRVRSSLANGPNRLSCRFTLSRSSMLKHTLA